MKKQQEGSRSGRWLPTGALLATAAILALVTGRELGLGTTPTPSIPSIWPGGVDGQDRDAAAQAQRFLRLVADSRRNEDTAPLPCTCVSTSGFLNPCMDALKQRWPELEPIEEVGPKLTVRSVTSSSSITAVVTEADISPRPHQPISITLERVSRDGVHGWVVRQLNHRDLPR